MLCRRFARRVGVEVAQGKICQAGVLGGADADLLQLSAKVIGDRGQLGALNPVAPFRRLSVRSADGNCVERFPRRLSFAYQLDAFAAAVLREPVKMTPQDAIENMAVIDAIYRAAGLSLCKLAGTLIRSHSWLLGNILRIWLG